MPKNNSKRYRSALKVADLTKEYPLKEAVEILTKFPKAKVRRDRRAFLPPRRRPASGDQMVRGTTPLPERIRQEGSRYRLHR
jgi:large subunit ribosomal protein L1